MKRCLGRIAVSALALCPCLSLCAPAREEYHDWLPMEPDVWSVRSREAAVDPHAVVLFLGYVFDDHDRVMSDRLYSRYFRARLIDEHGIQLLGTRQITFPMDAELRQLRARTVKPDGSCIEVKKSEVFDKGFLEQGDLTYRVKAFAFAGLEPGDIVEYFFSIKTSPYWLPAAPLQMGIPVREALVHWNFWTPGFLSDAERSAYSGRLPSAGWLVINSMQCQGTVEQLPDRVKPDKLHLRYTDVPPHPQEPYMPPEDVVAMAFGGYYDLPDIEGQPGFWEQIAWEQGQSTRDFIAEDDEVALLLGSSRQQRRDFERDLDACLSILREHVTPSAYLPAAARPDKVPDNADLESLLRRGRGRSYDVDRFLVALLRGLGYDATVFWGCDRSQGAFIDQWHFPRQFDSHGIVALKGDELVWCCPSIPSARRGSLPWQVQQAEVLLENLARPGEVNPFPTRARTPALPADANRKHLSFELRVDLEGHTSGTLVAHWDCPSDPLLTAEISGLAEQERCARLREELGYGDLWLNPRGERLTVRSCEISYQCSLEVQGLTERAGNQLLITPGRLRPDNYRIPAGPRSSEIWFQFPCTQSVSVTIQAPEGYQAVSAIPRSELETPFGRHGCGLVERDGRSVWEREFVLNHCLFKPSAAPALRDFLESVYAADERPFVLAPIAAAR